MPPPQLEQGGTQGCPHEGWEGLCTDLGLLCPESLPTGLPKEEPLAVCSLEGLRGWNWGQCIDPSKDCDLVTKT